MQVRVDFYRQLFGCCMVSHCYTAADVLKKEDSNQHCFCLMAGFRNLQYVLLFIIHSFYLMAGFRILE